MKQISRDQIDDVANIVRQRIDDYVSPRGRSAFEDELKKARKVIVRDRPE